MKIQRLLPLALVCLVGLCAQTSIAQKKTIVLVRHAEKSTTGNATDMAKGDPELSPEGLERAERLAKAVKKYKPDVVYSTEYKRTKQTAEPIAKLRHKEVQTYDPAKQADLIPLMLNGKPKHYLIVGHSNTTPALANMLFKKEVFKQLPDTEYGVYWVIKTKKGEVIKVEMYAY